MKIFRGPISKPFDDVAHELVTDLDPERSGSFINKSVVLVANIAKEPLERQSIAHIQLDASDVLSLHRRLLTGLLTQSNEYDSLKARVAIASQKLYRLYEEYSQESGFTATGNERIAELESHLSAILDVVGTLANELDGQ